MTKIHSRRNLHISVPFPQLDVGRHSSRETQLLSPLDYTLLIQTEYWGGELELKFHLIGIEKDKMEIRIEESAE